MNAFAWFPAAMLAAASPLPAQDAPPTSAPPPVTAEQALAAAQEVYGPPDLRPRAECPAPTSGGEIVVCAEIEDPSQYRVQSSGDLDPTGAGARGGGPRAPELGTAYPGVVVARGCFIPPCPPPMPVLIDLKALPDAPPGSDAERMGQGLAPRGRD